MAQNYYEQIANWRMQRRQEEAQSRVREMADDYRAAIRERDAAIANGDPELAASADDQCEYLEREYANLIGPQRPQMHPASAEYLQKYSAFRQRHGAAADQAIRDAHIYATRAPAQHATPQAAASGQHGMGLRPNTPEYFEAITHLLSLYAKDRGLQFDPEETALTPKEVCTISGTSPQQYNANSRAAYAAGAFEFQRNRK